MPKICQKSHKNHLKLDPGDSWGRSCGHCSPQGPPGYPKGHQNRCFWIKDWIKCEKQFQEFILLESSILAWCLFLLWLIFAYLGNHKNNEKCVTICKLRGLACWRWGCIADFISVALGSQNGDKMAANRDQNGIQWLQHGLQEGVRKRHEKRVRKRSVVWPHRRRVNKARWW